MSEKQKDPNEDKEGESAAEEGSDEGRLTKEDEPYSDMGSFGIDKRFSGISESLDRFIWGSERK